MEDTIRRNREGKTREEVIAERRRALAQGLSQLTELWPRDASPQQRDAEIDAELEGAVIVKD